MPPRVLLLALGHMASPQCWSQQLSSQSPVPDSQSSALATALMQALGAKDSAGVVLRVVRSDADWGSGT